MHTCRAAPSFQITAGHGGAVPEPRRLPPSRPARVGPAQKPQQDELRWMEPTLLTGCGGGGRRAPAETACRLPRGAGLLPLRDSAWKRPVGRVRRDGDSGGSWPRRLVAGGPPAASAPTYLRVLRLWAVRPSLRAGGPHRGEPGSCSRLKLPLAARRPHNYTWKAAELARGHTVWACLCVWGGARRAPGVSGPAARAECPGEGEGDRPPAASGRPPAAALRPRRAASPVL